MFDSRDIIETISMIREECLDIRTITMGISLYDCQSENPERLCNNIYDRIMAKAANLVRTGEDIEKKYGIPIINKRVSVTPAALLAGNLTPDDAVKLAKTLDRAAKELGINFIGGFSALVQKGFSNGSGDFSHSAGVGGNRTGLFISECSFHQSRYQYGCRG